MFQRKICLYFRFRTYNIGILLHKKIVPDKLLHVDHVSNTHVFIRVISADIDMRRQLPTVWIFLKKITGNISNKCQLQVSLNFIMIINLIKIKKCVYWQILEMCNNTKRVFFKNTQKFQISRLSRNIFIS